MEDGETGADRTCACASHTGRHSPMCTAGRTVCARQAQAHSEGPDANIHAFDALVRTAHSIGVDGAQTRPGNRPFSARAKR